MSDSTNTNIHATHVRNEKPPPKPTIFSRIGGFSFVLSLFLTAYMGSTFLLFPAIIILPFSLSLYRSWTDMFASLWFRWVVLWTEWGFGTKIIVTGDDTRSKEKDSAIVISNHRTRLDWFYLWSFFLRRGRLNNEKIILKDALRSIPGFGWAMQTFCFLFIGRNWEKDQQHITTLLRRFTDANYPVQLLLFPEGTDLTENTKSRSDKWCKEQNPPLPPYDYCLHPRVRGFEHCSKLLRGTIDAIYDVTIGYPDFIPQNEKLLLQGILPREIHYHVRRYPLSELPTDDKALGKWVESKWAEKEENLKRFYSSPNTSERGSFNFLSSSPSCSKTKENDNFFPLLRSFLVWTSCLVLAFWGLWNYSLVRWYFLFVNLTFIIVTKFFNGLESLELWVASGKSQSKKK